MTDDQYDRPLHNITKQANYIQEKIKLMPKTVSLTNNLPWKNVGHSDHNFQLIGTSAL